MDPKYFGIQVKIWCEEKDYFDEIWFFSEYYEFSKLENKEKKFPDTDIQT